MSTNSGGKASSLSKNLNTGDTISNTTAQNGNGSASFTLPPQSETPQHVNTVAALVNIVQQQQTQIAALIRLLQQQQQPLRSGSNIELGTNTNTFDPAPPSKSGNGRSQRRRQGRNTTGQNKRDNVDDDSLPLPSSGEGKKVTATLTFGEPAQQNDTFPNQSASQPCFSSRYQRRGKSTLFRDMAFPGWDIKQEKALPHPASTTFRDTFSSNQEQRQDASPARPVLSHRRGTLLRDMLSGNQEQRQDAFPAQPVLHRHRGIYLRDMLSDNQEQSLDTIPAQPVLSRRRVLISEICCQATRTRDRVPFLLSPRQLRPENTAPRPKNILFHSLLRMGKI